MKICCSRGHTFDTESLIEIISCIKQKKNERRYIVEVVEVSTLHFKYLQNQSRGVLDVIDLKTNKILACWENHESCVYLWNMVCACESIQLHEPYELWRKKHQKTPECPNQRMIHREKSTINIPFTCTWMHLHWTVYRAFHIFPPTIMLPRMWKCSGDEKQFTRHILPSI